jgi:hypothetical protein
MLAINIQYLELNVATFQRIAMAQFDRSYNEYQTQKCEDFLKQNEHDTLR